MYRLMGIAAAGLVVLGGGARAHAQHHVHLHGHYHHDHYYHDHFHHAHLHYYGHYYSYPGYTTGYATAYPATLAVTSPSVVVYATQPAGSAGVVPAGAATLRANPLPPYAGPGVTVRLPAEFTASLFVRIDRRDVEVRPGSEVALRDKGSYLVEFDQGGGFGPYSGVLGEGAYRFAVGPRGWQLVPDAPRPNPLPPPQ